MGSTTHQIIEREEFFPPGDIFKEINDFIQKNGEPDYVWLKGSGEPTLYLGFKTLSQLIKEKYPNLKIGSWLNGSLLNREDVQSELSICDLLVFHFDSINPKEFLKISRPHKEVTLSNIMKGIRLFKNNFKGKFFISSVFVNSINANEKNIEGLKDFLLKINPDLYLIQEFNNDKYQPLSEKFRVKIKEKFRALPFEVKFLLE